MRFLLLAAFCVAVSLTAAESFPGLQLHKGFRARVFAGSNHVGNAVAICFDRAGDLYTVEAHRRITGTWGVTMSRWWSMEDYAGRTLADREAMYARWAHIVPPAKLTRDADLLRRVRDRDGDGIADGSEILGRFNAPLDGNAAGVLALGEQLFVANAPNLWRMPLDRPEKREPLHTGLGVRVGVYGHDLHGLVSGPDGRVYFSLGDRGFHVRTREGRTLSAPTRGAVFRCFPDGSGLELFHVGLRNPQDLAFNEVGDLFTVDNDMGGVDHSRVVHVIEGGDSGWDASYQLTRNFREETKRADHTEPPWFTEGLWELRHEGQPAWLHPPVAHLTQGPSGMEFDPGWGLPAELRGALLVCDFRGTSSRSGIYSFHLEADGAGYEMTRTNKLAWGILPADIEFGHDGCLYLADWIGGWGGDGERRIVRLEFEQTRSSNPASEVRALLTGNWQARSKQELKERLDHFDRRVRLHAQYELARRQQQDVLLEAASDSTAPLVKRLHGIHGLWQIGLRHSLPTTCWPSLNKLLSDPEAEIRAQIAKVLGETGPLRHTPEFVALLHDPKARVRHFATVSLGKIGNADVVQPLIDLLRRERDPIVRQAAARALSRLVSASELVAIGQDYAPRIRLAAVLALRHARSPLVARLLDDREPAVRFAAIRASHDLEIPTTMSALADFATAERLANENVPFTVRHRLLNARFRRGHAKDARFLSKLAVDTELPKPVRLEALRSLDHWIDPSPFDRVTWHHHPITHPRDLDIAGSIEPALLRLIAPEHRATEDAKILQSAARLVARFKLGREAELLSLLTDPRLPTEVRTPIFQRLAVKPTSAFTEACETLLKGKNQQLRILAAEALHAGDRLASLWKSGPESTRRFLLGRTNLMAGSWGIARLREALRLESAKSGPLALDLLTAAERSPNAPLRELAAAWRAELTAATNSLGRYRLALAGGDAANGKRLFATHAVQCVRCHRVKGFGGDAGPDLSRIGRELKRPDIVTALIEPSARIAPGFGTFEFELRNGEEISGFLERETPEEITLLQLDGHRRSFAAKSIRKRSAPASSMPTMRDVLTVSEARDLAAYLAGLK